MTEINLTAKYECAHAILQVENADEGIVDFITRCAASNDAEKVGMAVQLAGYSGVPASTRYRIIRAALNDRDDYNVVMALQRLPSLGKKAAELTDVLERLLGWDIPVAALATKCLLQNDPQNLAARQCLSKLLPMLEAVRDDEAVAELAQELIQVARKLGLPK